MTSAQKFDCIFCKETFSDKETLQVHFRKHGDPNYSHSKASNDKSKDDSDMVRCDVCLELFPTISKAITHKHKVHPDHDTKYFCSWCGKLFTLKHLYDKHVKASHEKDIISSEEIFNCDCCNVDFFVPGAMLYHNKFFHRQEAELPSIGHSKKQKLVQQELLPIYYCPFCGEEFINKVNLLKHISDDHHDENQSPEDVMRCPLCEAIFYHLDAYELHLTFHSTEDVYSEKNELTESGITEFSLEVVQPIMEKIENLSEQQEDPESTMEPIELESLLQLAMDTEENGGLKPKKRKKHKKSKKSAITLDEFLDMNKEVFGEGLNVHGIEEVPTQAIAKKLRKQPQPQTAGGKPDINKLRQQGIVVKLKSGKSNIQGMKIGTKIPENNPNISRPSSSSAPELNVDCHEALNKLQSTQIKIVKKSNQISTIPKNGDNNDQDVGPQLQKDNCQENPEETKSTKTDNEEMSSVYADKKVCLEESEHETPTRETSQPALDKSTKYEDTNLPKKSPESFKKSENLKEMPVQGDVNKQLTETEQSSEKSKALDALKHLSHLITIKSVNSPSPKQEQDSQCEDNENNENSEKSNDSINVNNQMLDFKLKQHNSQKFCPQLTVKSSKTSEYSNTEFDTGEKIGQASTTKINDPLTNDQNSLKTVHQEFSQNNTEVNDLGNDYEQFSDDHEEMHANIDKKEHKNQSIKHLSDNLLNTLKNSGITIHSKSSESTLKTEQGGNSTDSQPDSDDETLTKLKAKAEIKKITAKKCFVNLSQDQIIFPKLAEKKIDTEAEIYKIDDSDTDNEENQTLLTLKSTIKPEKDDENIPVLLKNKQNINRNITIKSNKPKTDAPDEIPEFTEEADDDSFFESETNTMTMSKNMNLEQANTKNELKNALKNLGKNITVKSRNTSPMARIPIQSQGNNISENPPLPPRCASRDNYEYDAYPGKVTISEITDDYEHCEDEHHKLLKCSNGPKEVFSDKEMFDENEDEPVSDFEHSPDDDNTQSKFDKSAEKQTAYLDTIKNLGKNITIKSLNSNKPVPQSQESAINTVGPLKTNINKEAATQEKTKMPLSKNTQQHASASNNQKVSQGQNQVSTVNKEVTVKTFQTKTVVQEITTTVTKTIRTVNQTMKQETQNTNQYSSATKMQQNVQQMNIRPTKNFQGMQVRHAQPLRPKIRGSVIPARPPTSTIRPSNQLVPVRPGVNLIRAQSPRMPTKKQNLTIAQKPNTGKPLKIAPNVVNTTKRPSGDDGPNGPFSCFKKSKETGFPDPHYHGNMVSEASMHMSKSNFTSSAKTVKGNTVVTSTQSKSEASASLEQLNRLSNLSGLKIMKKVSKQESHVEETHEMDTSKRSALEAIEKLQKQGLLIKKPRIEASEESDHSNSGEEASNCLIEEYDE